MMVRWYGLALAVVVLSACAKPTGPSVMVLPGSGKSLEHFQADDASCRGAANRQTGTTAGRTYDMTYLQCMYAHGHQIPIPGSTQRPAANVPAPPASTQSSWIGTWQGTWNGTPLTLVVLEQGPSYRPGATALSGIMTSMVGGEPTTVNIAGWVEPADRSRTAVFTADTRLGLQQLTLTRVEENRLTGTGESTFRWGPQGPVDLLRAAAAPAS